MSFNFLSFNIKFFNDTHKAQQQNFTDAKKHSNYDTIKLKDNKHWPVILTDSINRFSQFSANRQPLQISLSVII
jgi:hypothetical protein